MKRNLLFTFILLIAAAMGCKAQIFYKVEGNGLKSPSYLFGTHHFAPTSMLDSLPQVKEALNNADCVVGELDMTANPMAMVQTMQAHMMAPADSTISKLVDEKQFAYMDSVVTALTGGISLRLFDTMKPIAVEVTVSGMLAAKELQETGQLDTYFQQVAKLQNKQIKGLETADFQAQVLFDVMPIDKQLESLISVLEKPDEIMKATHELTNAYLSRDADAIWEIGKESSKDSDGEFFEILLTKRNEAWMQKLPSMMEEAPLFIAVGALHLYGDNGIIESLRKAGYTVTPIL